MDDLLYDVKFFDDFVNQLLAGQQPEVTVYVNGLSLSESAKDALRKDLLTACAIIKWQDELTASFAKEAAEREAAIRSAASVPCETEPLAVRGLFPQIPEELDEEFADWAKDLPESAPGDTERSGSSGGPENSDKQANNT